MLLLAETFVFTSRLLIKSLIIIGEPQSLQSTKTIAIPCFFLTDTYFDVYQSAFLNCLFGMLRILHGVIFNQNVVQYQVKQLIGTTSMLPLCYTSTKPVV